MLHAHPWFHLHEVVASEARAGAAYGDAVSWMAGGEVPVSAAALRLLAPGAALTSPVVLSALPSGAARELEPALAARGHLVSSNASAHRMDARIPLVVPEVNAGAMDAVDAQPWAASGGALVTNPNCVVAGLAPVLSVVDRRWPIASIVAVTLQALSGAGIAGPSALAMTGNVIPFIAGEEEKIAAELSRILGRDIPTDVAVNRVPVVDGHLAHLFLDFDADVDPADIALTLREARAPQPARSLPTVPDRTLRVVDDPHRPQPALDLDQDSGMEVVVGRIRGGGRRIALTVLSHNLIRGAAGACLANAELLVSRR
jgi:aspartate-semialdehyde dehydrogenase